MSKKRKPNKPSRRGTVPGSATGPGPRPAQSARAPRSGQRKAKESSELWLWGHHAVEAALANPRRRCLRLIASDAVVERESAELKAAIDRGNQAIALEKCSAKEIDSQLPEGAVHQGLALLTQPLSQPNLHDCIKDLPSGRQVIVALDQVTDPHNVGAIIRSAAVFGAVAVLTTDRNAPAESGLLAKTASGGFDRVPYIQETNLSRALEFLKDQQFWCLGLASRRLTREHCDLLLSIEAPGAMADLNVSNATAVCLYEFLARQTR